MTDQEFFDVRFICDTCHGEGKVPIRTKQGPGGKTYCRRCLGTGMCATGKQIQQLVREIEILKSKSQEEVSFLTDDKEVIGVKFSGEGVNVWSTTGYLQAVILGDSQVAIIVVKKGGEYDEN
jgi:hypothetical protein